MNVYDFMDIIIAIIIIFTVTYIMRGNIKERIILLLAAFILLFTSIIGFSDYRDNLLKSDGYNFHR